MSEALPREIHAVLISVGSVRVLLPNAIVAEIAPFASLEKIDGAPFAAILLLVLFPPSWLLGVMPWRDRAIPIISFPRLTGSAL